MKAIPIGLALLAALVLSPGCSRDIGDQCTTSVDCDPNGTRSCDLSQPGGYCTIVGCTETSCPSDSACIRTFPTQFLTKSCDPACEDLAPCCLATDSSCSGLPSCGTCMTGPTNDCAADELCLDAGKCARRSLEQRYCAKTCGGNGDCRSGYLCRRTDSTLGGSTMLLTSTPGAQASFCAPAPNP